MRALISDGKGGLAIDDMPEPAPASSETLIEVLASSVNRGETRLIEMLSGVLGLDIAGRVLRPAADGTGPAEGELVFGWTGRRLGGWAERAAVPAANLAVIPQGLGIQAAACLPTAGLTALAAIRVAGSRAGGNVLVNGATGGVGRVLVELSLLAGAEVTAAVSRPERAVELAGLAVKVVTGEDYAGPFDAIFDGLNGPALSQAMRQVAPGGIVINYGGQPGYDAPATAAEIPLGWFLNHPGASLYGLDVGWEIGRQGGAASDLAQLGGLAATGRLRPAVNRVAPLAEAPFLIAQLRQRAAPGKSVIRIGAGED